MNAVGSFYDTYLNLFKEAFFKTWGNPSNCLQAKGNLAEVNNELAEALALGYTNDIGRARVDALKALVDYLNQFIAMNCNDDGVSTIVDVPTGSTDDQLPLPTGPDDFATGEPAPTGSSSNNMIWIAGAALIGFIIWNNKKKRRK